MKNFFLNVLSLSLYLSCFCMCLCCCLRRMTDIVLLFPAMYSMLLESWKSRCFYDDLEEKEKKKKANVRSAPCGSDKYSHMQTLNKRNMFFLQNRNNIDLHTNLFFYLPDQIIPKWSFMNKKFNMCNYCTNDAIRPGASKFNLPLGLPFTVSHLLIY